MADEEVNKILACINKSVTYKYPEKTKYGRLIDRAVLECPCERGGIPYWDVVDLIKFDDEQEPQLRIGYYRKAGQNLKYCSQTTITEPISTWRKLLVKAAREKTWFRELLEEVVSEVRT